VWGVRKVGWGGGRGDFGPEAQKMHVGQEFTGRFNPFSTQLFLLWNLLFGFVSLYV